MAAKLPQPLSLQERCLQVRTSGGIKPVGIHQAAEQHTSKKVLAAGRSRWRTGDERSPNLRLVLECVVPDGFGGLSLLLRVDRRVFRPGRRLKFVFVH